MLGKLTRKGSEGTCTYVTTLNTTLAKAQLGLIVFDFKQRQHRHCAPRLSLKSTQVGDHAQKASKRQRHHRAVPLAAETNETDSA
jgi:hypothetical protein